MLHQPTLESLRALKLTGMAEALAQQLFGDRFVEVKALAHGPRGGEKLVVGQIQLGHRSPRVLS